MEMRKAIFLIPFLADVVLRRCFRKAGLSSSGTVVGSVVLVLECGCT